MPGDQQTVEGPLLADLARRLADAPPDLQDPAADVAALVRDTVDLLAGPGVVGALQGPVRARVDDACADPACAVLAGAVCWLLRDPGLRSHPAFAQAVRPESLAVLVLGPCLALAPLREPRAWVFAPAGREELSRAVLGTLGLRPAGESPALAADRWTAISTAEQRRIAQEMAHEARRAEQLARELAEKRAREAAAQYTNY